MVDAFATYEDLEARLNRAFTVEEQSWVTTLLEDASTYLRDDVIGFQVYPQEQVTFTAWPDAGCQVVLPPSPERHSTIASPQARFSPVESSSSVTDGNAPPVAS